MTIKHSAAWWAEQFGLRHETSARKRLAKMIAAGEVEKRHAVSTAPRKAFDGTRGPLIVLLYVPTKEAT